MVTKLSPLSLLANWFATPLILKEPAGRGKTRLKTLYATLYATITKSNRRKPTRPLHVLQFDVNFAGCFERQCGLAPWDHWCVDHIQRAESHSPTGLSEHLYCNAVC